jgi:predicted GTPase
MEVGVNMESCTKNIVATVLTKTPNKALNDALSGRRLVLVDTPGFDDTVMGDEEILRRISLWLEAS